MSTQVSEDAGPRISIEQDLARLVQAMVTSHDKVVVPLKPWILVRVLPKEQKTSSGIILADVNKSQNKPNHEGVVLSVWRVRQGEDASSLERGDHIIFPHFEGVPVPFLHEDKYRLIKEDVVPCVIDYIEPPIIDTLQGELEDQFPDLDFEEYEDAAIALIDKFSMVYVDREPVTTSGA